MTAALETRNLSKSWGGFVVKVVRVGDPDVYVQEHASESALDRFAGWDYVLEAVTVESLRVQALAMYERIERTRRA